MFGKLGYRSTVQLKRRLIRARHIKYKLQSHCNQARSQDKLPPGARYKNDVQSNNSFSD